jgi:subtilisin family serine protease
MKRPTASGGIGIQQQQVNLQAMGAVVQGRSADSSTVIVDASLASASAIALDPSVAYVEPDHALGLFETTPNDTLFTSADSWGMKAQPGSRASQAWDLTTGSASTIIAVIDTGIDLTHPEFAGKLWTNPNEIANNGIDDDGNGYIDDVSGYDFINQDNDPTDDHGHGTHVTGIIAAQGLECTNRCSGHICVHRHNDHLQWNRDACHFRNTHGFRPRLNLPMLALSRTGLHRLCPA